MSRTVYRAPAALGVRGVGYGAVGVGIAVIAAVVVAAAGPSGGLAGVLWSVVAVVAVIAFVMLLTGILRVSGWRARLILDDDGFTNATGPRAGQRRVRWRDVRKVQSDGPVVLVDVAGSRQSVIRTGTLDVEPAELARELRSRLNQDRGYTPFGTAEVGESRQPAARDQGPDDSSTPSPGRTE